MDKETEKIIKERIISSLDYDSCPSCGSTDLIYEVSTYNFVKFIIVYEDIEIVNDTMDRDTKHEQIQCLQCSWKEEI